MPVAKKVIWREIIECIRAYISLLDPGLRPHTPLSTRFNRARVFSASFARAEKSGRNGAQRPIKFIF